MRQHKIKKQKEHPKGANRYSTWSPQWSDIEHEVFRDFGFAAFAAQMLESSIVQILIAAYYAGQIQLEDSSDINAMLSKKTLGQLFRLMKEKGAIDRHLAELLQDALNARNELIHRFFVQDDKFLTDKGRGKMLMELQKLRFRIGRAQFVFSQIRGGVFNHCFGISQEAAQKLYRKSLVAHKRGRQKRGPSV